MMFSSIYCAAMLPRVITTVEQRYLRGPSQWSGDSCLVTTVDMGPLAYAMTTEHPRLAGQLLSLLPGLRDFEFPMRHGAFLAEVMGRIALELQAIAGARCRTRCPLTIHGRNGCVRIIIEAQDKKLAAQALNLAASLLLDLCNGKTVSIRARLKGLARGARTLQPFPVWRGAARAPSAASAVPLELLHAHPAPGAVAA